MPQPSLRDAGSFADAGVMSADDAGESTDAGLGDAGVPVREFKCIEHERDRLYRCPYRAIDADAEFLFVKLHADGSRAIATGSIAGPVTEIAATPEGWTVNLVSLSPDRANVLVTAERSDCAPDWPNPAGERCLWGRGTLWRMRRVDDAAGAWWEYTNVSAVELGTNSIVIGWTTWLTPTLALFNGKRADPGVALVKSEADDASVAYVYDLLGTPKMRRWGDAVGLNSGQCFIGRMHSSEPGLTNSCRAGQRVAITRRCNDEPVSPQLYAWFNSVNDDGSGGVCAPSARPPWIIAAFRVYVVELNSACEPIAFDRQKPIRAPDWQGTWRHMGSAREWGDGQSTISNDGRWVAFWSQHGYDGASPTDNCEAFAGPNGTLGNGSTRVRYCALNNQLQCVQTETILAPTDHWAGQGNAYFHRDSSDAAVLLMTSEGGSIYLNRRATQTRELIVPSAGGGYPIAKGL